MTDYRWTRLTPLLRGEGGDQVFLGAFAQGFDQTLMPQAFALARPGFVIHQRHGRAGLEEARALATPVLGETALLVIIDAGIERALRRASPLELNIRRAFSANGEVG